MVPSRVVRRMVETELAECGYRVNFAKTPWEAFELAVCTLPDIIITSVVMDHISGAELARALGEVGAVRNTQFAVLTSFEPGHAELRGIPQQVEIIGLGSSFTMISAILSPGSNQGRPPPTKPNSGLPDRFEFFWPMTCGPIAYWSKRSNSNPSTSFSWIS